MSRARIGLHPVPLLFLLLIALAGLLAGSGQARAGAPGLANRAYPPEQLFRVLGVLNAQNGAPQEHSTVVFHQGYIVQVYSEENDRPRAGIAVFDLTDPAAPRLVAQTERDTEHLSEQHAIGFSNVDGTEYAALLAVGGIEIWDWTDIANLHRVARLELPGVEVGYGLGAWWLAWQAPYLYVSGASNGIYIVDTADPRNPRLVDRGGGAPNPIPTGETGGFRVGPIFAVGNLLVISANDGRGYATLDIGDPANPLLLDVLLERGPPSYSSMVNGNRIYALGTDDDFHALDITDPLDIRRLDSVAMFGRGGYLTVQDHFAHVGASNYYAKIDLADPDEFRVVGTATSSIPNRDEDFVAVLGNLAVISDDTYNGSYIVAHQAEPDTTGPLVNMVVPAPNARNQSRATRIGLTFTDRIDLRTVTPETLIVRPVDGEPIWGRYSHQTNIVNFTPDRPLEVDTTYEILVPAGGVRDVVGNPIPDTFRAVFTTGDTVGAGFWCDIDPPAPVETGQTLRLRTRVLEGPADVAFRWDFGDGSPATATTPNPEGIHTYAAPGHYTVRVTAGSGSRATSCTTRVTVFNRIYAGTSATAGSIAGLASSTIILDRSGTQIWNVNPDHDTVTATDAVLLKRMFEVPVGRHPRTLAQAPDGTVWVANQDSATLSVLQADTGTLLGTIPLPPGSEPFAVVFSPARSAAFVSLQATGQLAVVDASARSVVQLLDVGPAPRALAFTPDGRRLFVTRFISPDTHGEVVEVDPQTVAVVRRLTLPFDPGPDSESSGRGVPNGLNAIVASPDGRRLWIAGRKHNIARGQQRDGQTLTFETTVRSMLAQVDLASGEEQLAARYDFNNRDGPVAARFSPRGDYLFVVLEGSNAVDVVDVYSGQLVASIEGVGAAPQGLAFTSDGSKLFVHSWLTRSLFVYDVSGLLQPAGRSAQFIADLPVTNREALPQDVLAGKRIFYNAEDPRMDRDEYLACASCHLDSREDGRVWDRTAEGEGLRNTISLLGRGRSGHGRIHWSANFDEIQDFENDIRTAFGGTGFLPQDAWTTGTHSQPLGDPKAGLSPELDALAQYVASLSPLPASPYRRADGALTPEGEQGKVLFYTLGCPACHGGPEFTDSPSQLLHDVGTLTPASGRRLGQPLLGLDTPTLRGLWLTAPYLHDGSAATLSDLFTGRNPDNRHGDIASALRADLQALDHLIAYLLQIDDREPAPPSPQPAIEIVRPAPGTTIAAGRPLVIAVDTAPALGPIDRVEFLAGFQLLGEDRGPIYTYTWESPPPGRHSLQARLVYASGAQTITPPVEVEIAP